MAAVVDLTGHRFNRLLVERREGSIGGRATWACRCDCGTAVVVQGKLMVNGTTSSCGCLRSDNLRKHGMSGTRTYRIWFAMVRRCHVPKAANFHNYGGRGISVCEEWHTIDGFVASMGNAPGGMSIERIDNNRGYSPDNCRWASGDEQALNKRTNLVLTHNGKSQPLAQWARELNIGATTIHNRLVRGLSVDEALTAPVLKRNRQKKET